MARASRRTCTSSTPRALLVYAGGIDSIPSARVDDIAKATNYVRQALAEIKAGKPVSVAATSRPTAAPSSTRPEGASCRPGSAYTAPMSRTPDTISTLRDVLGHCRTLAVVGLSPQWHRPSYFAAKYMQSHGYRIVPVNPLVAREGGSILGERCFASVVEAAQAIAAQGGRIDMVDCFRKSEDIPPLAEEADRHRRALPVAADSA